MQQIIIYSIITGALILLVLILSTSPSRANVKANRWLSLFLISYSCITVDFVFRAINLYQTYSSVQALLEVTRFAMAPALYFSVVYFTSPDRVFSRNDYLHFLPFALFLVFILSVLLHVNDGPLFAWYGKLPEGVRRGVAFTVFASIKVQMIVYWILAYLRLNRHLSNIKLFASSIEPITLSWLRYFLLGFAVVLFLSLNQVLEIFPAIMPITDIGYLVITFYIGYFSLRQTEVYPYRKEAVAELQTIIEEDKASSRNSRMPSDDVVAAKQKLIVLMETNKPYLNPDLGLPELAELSGISTHNLSYVLNEGFKENFFQFVNRYRIEEAKFLLTSTKHKHLNVLGIAFEAGFRSKTTFNTTFRKLTGMSPSQFSHTGEPTKQPEILLK